MSLGVWPIAPTSKHQYPTVVRWATLSAMGPAADTAKEAAIEAIAGKVGKALLRFQSL